MKPLLKQLAIATGLAALMLAGMSPDPAQAKKATASGKNMSRQVAALSNANKADKVEVIVVYKNKPGKREKQRVKALGGKTKRQFKKLRMRTLSVSAKRLKKLANNPNIELIALDAPVSALSAAARKTAKLPPQASANAIYDGTGVTIAVLDSGVGEHEDINVSVRLGCELPTGGGTGSFRDEFSTTSYSNSDGSADWMASPWLESDDNGRCRPWRA